MYALSKHDFYGLKLINVVGYHIKNTRNRLVSQIVNSSVSYFSKQICIFLTHQHWKVVITKSVSPKAKRWKPLNFKFRIVVIVANERKDKIHYRLLLVKSKKEKENPSFNFNWTQHESQEKQNLYKSKTSSFIFMDKTKSQIYKTRYSYSFILVPKLVSRYVVEIARYLTFMKIIQFLSIKEIYTVLLKAR